MVHLQLVKTLNQVKQNLKQYNLELQNGQMSLSSNRVRQWFYIMELDFFGPSRYIGYEDITIQKHQQATNLDGKETNKALSRWFVECDDPELFNLLSIKLTDYLAHFDMSPGKRYGLNLLKEDIPKLKANYLSNTPNSEITKCQTCNRHFTEEPFYAHNSRGPYCSQKCLPQDVLKEYKADEYIRYLEAYRAIISYYIEISDIESQIYLLNKLELTESSLANVETSSNSEYVAFIQKLRDKFAVLSYNVANYFVDESHLDIQKAFTIQWPAFEADEFVDYQLTYLIDFMKTQLNGISSKCNTLNNLAITVDFSNNLTIYFNNEEACIASDNLLTHFYDHFENYLNDFDLKFFLSDYIQLTKVAACPKCGEYDLLNNFSLDNNVFCCSNCKENGD